jgi:hypothetical protein
LLSLPQVEAFIAAADAIEAAFPGVIVEGNEDGDGRPGSFEVKTEDGLHIFSRLQGKGALPDVQLLVSALATRTALPSTPLPAEDACG